MAWKQLCDAIVRTITGVSGADNAKARSRAVVKSQRRVEWSERWDERRDELVWEGATREYELC